MKGSEFLRSGLKLLGAYFLIVGLSESGNDVCRLLEAQTEEAKFLNRYIVNEAHASLTAAAIKVLGGIALIVGASVCPRRPDAADSSN